MVQVIVRLAVTIAVMSLLAAYEQNPERVTLEWMRTRVKGYQAIARWCGGQAITLEAKYLAELETSRLI